MLGPLVNLLTYKAFGIIACFSLCSIIEVVSCFFMAYFMGRAPKLILNSNASGNCQEPLTDSEQNGVEVISFMNFPSVKLLIAIEFICSFSCHFWLEGVTSHLINMGYN